VYKKIIILTKGPNKNYSKGQEIEVDSARAAALIKGKHAKPCGEDSEEDAAEGGDDP